VCTITPLSAARRVRACLRARHPSIGAGPNIRYEFRYEGGGVGKGGAGTLFVDGQRVGEKLARTIPFIFSADDFTDVGNDYGAPLTEDYEIPRGRFTGEISWSVSISVKKTSPISTGSAKRSLVAHSSSANSNEFLADPLGSTALR
jgi:hypothetical protein